jgi:calcineurin-like phosphoesterase family protein
VGEMDRFILNNINEVVDDYDTLWHLGDFSFGHNSSPSAIIWTRRQIRCKTIHLIIGNHDKKIVKNDNLKSLFTSIFNYYKGKINGRDFLLMHRPPDSIPSWENSLWTKTMSEKPSTIWLHGHTHNNHHCGPHNMCVEIRQYKPISLDEIVQQFLDIEKV